MLRNSPDGRPRFQRRALAAFGVAATTATLAFSAAPADATTVNFCEGNYAGGQFCSRQASFSLNGISASTVNVDAVCVYRATANYDGAPNAGTQEFCIPAGGSNITQAFYGNVGNPTVHNHHSFSVLVGAAYDRN